MNCFLTASNAANHCRACLVNLDDLESVPECLSLNNTTYVNLKSYERILRILRMLIESNKDEETDDYPQNVCLVCFKVLEEFEEFRNRLVECDILLKNVIGKNLDVGTEMTEKKRIRSKIIEENHTVAEIIVKECTVTKIIEEDVTAIVENRNYEMETVFIVDDNNIEFYEGSTIETTLQYDDPIYGDTHSEKKMDNSMNKLIVGSKKDHKQINDTKSGYGTTSTPSVLNEIDIHKTTDHSEHEEINDKAFQCDQCKRGFIYKYKYEAHLRSAHKENTKRPFNCAYCDKNYKNVDFLRYHLHEVHNSNGRIFNCTNCGKSYKTAASLEQHRRSKHLGMKQHKCQVCEVCGASFVGTKNLEKHYIAKHNRVSCFSAAELECDQCKKSFSHPFSLHYHTLRQHATDAMLQCECSICGIKFAKKFMLSAHMRVHCKDEEKYTCDQCDRKFTQKFDVIKHIRVVHMKLKPFSCPHCRESFANERTLRHHVYTHTGEKPYPCDVCGKTFRQPTAMKTHRKNTHGS